MKNVQAFFAKSLVVVVPVIFALVGFGLGNVYLERYYDGAFEEWISLGSPPAPIETIWSAKFYDQIIVVQTDDGRLFEASLPACELSPENCWREGATIEQNGEWNDAAFPPCETRYDQFDRLPEPVTQCASLSSSGADVYVEIHFVTLADNSVWFWDFRTGGLSLPFLTFGFWLLCGALLLGGVFGRVVLTLMRRAGQSQKWVY